MSHAGEITELNPWRVIIGQLFELDSYTIPEIIDKTGMNVDWSFTNNQNYSNKLRKYAFRPRINSAYEKLSMPDQLRVAHIVTSELIKEGYETALIEYLEKIGWGITDGNLSPARKDVKELFFPKDTQHDAYVEIRSLFQRANTSITVIDPYVDSSLFEILKTLSELKLIIKIITCITPGDFKEEIRRFLAQHSRFDIESRKSTEFHDRFIIIDDREFWHIGCSIKDAGNKAFMLSKIEDTLNKEALAATLKKSWESASKI